MALKCGQKVLGLKNKKSQGLENSLQLFEKKS
jgi:hypothetical protein